MRGRGGRPVVYPDADAPLRERTRRPLADPALGGNLRAAARAAGRRPRARSRARTTSPDARRGARDPARRSSALPELLDRLEERRRGGRAGSSSRGDGRGDCATSPTSAARARRAPGREVEVDGHRGDQAQRGARGGGRRGGRDRPRRVGPAARRRAPAHILGPAVHKTRTQVRVLSRPRAAAMPARTARRWSPSPAARCARCSWPPTSASSASTSAWPRPGRICVSTNEGNGRLVDRAAAASTSR